MPECQTELILGMFEKDPNVQVPKCRCCYCCIKSHADEGCSDCLYFLSQYFPSKASLKLKKSVYKELKNALSELFLAMKISELRVEDNLKVDCSSFICDFLRVVDEVKSPLDIVKLWHIEKWVAEKIFSILDDVLYDYDSCNEEEINTVEVEDDYWKDEFSISSSDSSSESSLEEDSESLSDNDSESPSEEDSRVFE